MLPIVGLCLALVLLVTGCSKSSPSSPVSSALVSPSQTSTVIPTTSTNVATPQAAVVLSSATQYLATVTAYQLDSVVNNVSSSASDKSDQVSTTVNSQLILDLAGNKLQMNNLISYKESSGQFQPAVENSLYVVDNTLYIQGLYPDNPQTWTKTAATAGFWQAQNQARVLVELLQKSQITKQTRETLTTTGGSVLCDVLEVTPDLASLWNMLGTQPGIQLPSGAPPGVEFSQIIPSSKVKVWLAQSADYPLRAEITMSILVTPAQVSSLPTNLTMDIGLNMSFHDYNQPVTIELPPEARDAGDLNLTPGQ